MHAGTHIYIYILISIHFAMSRTMPIRQAVGSCRNLYDTVVRIAHSSQSVSVQVGDVSDILEAVQLPLREAGEDTSSDDDRSFVFTPGRVFLLSSDEESQAVGVDEVSESVNQQMFRCSTPVHE